VEEIVAYKIDALTYDHVCLAFRRAGDSSFLVVGEDTPGWNELNDQLRHAFGISSNEWFGQVAIPAFAENRTTLWTRAEGSLFPSRGT